MKIYKLNLTKVYCLEDIFNIKNLELIWERTETKRMTTEEMRVRLEELTGEKIEIEPICKGCVITEMCHDNGSQFVNYCDNELKQCYEKVIANKN